MEMATTSIYYEILFRRIRNKFKARSLSDIL